MGYLGDQGLRLDFGRIGRIDPEYFGRWKIEYGIYGSTYLGDWP